jgi:hypothetical protein
MTSTCRRAFRKAAKKTFLPAISINLPCFQVIDRYFITGKIFLQKNFNGRLQLFDENKTAHPRSSEMG